MPREVLDLALFPLNTVLFPGMPLPLHIFEERYRRMINECLEEEREFGVLLARLGNTGAEIGIAHRIGTSARITHVHRLENGRMNILTTGTERFRLLQLAETSPFTVGRVESFPLEDPDASEVTGLARQASSLFIKYLRRAREVVGDLVRIESSPQEARGLAYLIAGALQLSLQEKQLLLDTRTLPGLLRRELRVLGRELTVLERLHQVQQSAGGYVVGATGHFSLS